MVAMQRWVNPVILMGTTIALPSLYKLNYLKSYLLIKILIYVYIPDIITKIGHGTIRSFCQHRTPFGASVCTHTRMISFTQEFCYLLKFTDLLLKFMYFFILLLCNYRKTMSLNSFFRTAHDFISNLNFSIVDRATYRVSQEPPKRAAMSPLQLSRRKLGYFSTAIQELQAKITQRTEHRGNGFMREFASFDLIVPKV
jgi:hypothetical protein